MRFTSRRRTTQFKEDVIQALYERIKHMPEMSWGRSSYVCTTQSGCNGGFGEIDFMYELVEGFVVDFARV
jgi:hypothetical protein